MDGAETDLDDELDVVESSPSQEQLIVAESITDSEVMPPLPMISAIQMPIQMTQPPTLVSTPVGPHPSISLPRQAALQPTGLPQVGTPPVLECNRSSIHFATSAMIVERSS